MVTVIIIFLKYIRLILLIYTVLKKLYDRSTYLVYFSLDALLDRKRIICIPIDSLLNNKVIHKICSMLICIIYIAFLYFTSSSKIYKFVFILKVGTIYFLQNKICWFNVIMKKSTLSIKNFAIIYNNTSQI